MVAARVVGKATPPASTTMCPSSSRVEPSSLRRLKAYCPSRSVRSQPLHSTLNSCCGNDAEAAVMKSRLIRRSTRTTAGLSQFLLGENFTVIPRCGQTQRIGTRRIGTRRIRVRYRMFAPRPHLSREEVGSRDGSPRGPGWPVAGGRRLSTQAPPAALPPEEAILFDQIGERLPLPMIEPTDEGQGQQPKDRHVDHERELIPRTRQESP